MTTTVIDEGGKQPAFLSLFWRYVAIAALIWTVVIGGSLIWNFHLLDEQFAELAHKEAVANFNKDQGFRLWGTKHGGVYVPVTEETPPSPYLAHIPERDIETPSGRRLTLMNPAYMVRQLMEDHAELYGVRGRITGLVVLRPGNAPDEWEKQALMRLRDGADEVMEDAEIDGKPYHRLMRPMYMKPGCEKCHGHLGFKLGDFRGGVSVSVPLAPYIAGRWEGAGMLAISHGLIWLLGLGGVGISARQVRSRIEERDMADERLEAHRARFENLLNMAPDAFVVIDEEQRIQLFSQGASNVFGYRPEEVIGERIDILMPETFRTAHAKHIGAFDTSGQTIRLIGERGEVTGRRKDGSTFPAEASVSSLELSGEKLFTATLRDVTERNERDQILRQAQKMEAVGQLTGGLAHDFNNLLTVVLGNLEQISERVDDPTTGHMAQSAINASLRGAELTRRLLAFSRKQTLAPAVIELDQLLTEITNLMRRTLGESVEIEVTGGEDLWKCKADPGQLESALLNLALNARDAMPLGGKLTIETSNASLDDADVAARNSSAIGEFVKIAVSDTGTGMSQDTIHHVFEPFFTTKDVGSGSGLGLSMVHGFINQSNGFVTIDSTEGVGTTVTLYLPRSVEKSAAVQDRPKGKSPRSQGEKVLVVEDDPEVRVLTVNMLADLGYVTVEAADGKEAIEVLQQTPGIELLFTDVGLPGGMSGIEVAREAIRQFPDIKILFTSGYGDDVLARHGGISTDAELVNKPFRKEELARKLRAVMGQSLH